MIEETHPTRLMPVHASKAERDDRGATAVEYALLITLIAAVIVVIVGSVGQELLPGFTTIVNALP